MSGVAETKVSLLRSPATGVELHGLEADRVFAAPSEGRCYELIEGSLIERPYEAIAPDPRRHGPISWLPFWRVRFGAHVLAAPGLADDVVREVFAQHAAYVRAFSLINAVYLGDPGLALTASSPHPTHPGPLPACFGARLPAVDAAELGRLFLLELADRKHDITGVQVQTDVEDCTLVMVPFSEADGFFEMGVGSGVRFRRELLVDYEAIELCTNRRGAP